MFVRNWMSAPAVTVPASMSAPEALALMEKRKFRRLPVVDGEKLAGILTKTDLQKALGPVPATWNRLKLRVSDVMVKDVVSVQAGETLEGVAKLMLARKIAGIPVLDGGRVVGLITESDVFRALCEMLGFGEKGARVVFTAPEEADLLEAIRRRGAGLKLRALSSHFNKKDKRWEVVLRLRSRATAKAGVS